MKRAFTLIELLVVVGIIGVLMGVLMATFSGGTESARTARCLSNMKNLASACQTYGQENRKYPHAGSIEYQTIDESDAENVKSIYHEAPGWISWSSRGTYGNKPTSPQGGRSMMSSMYNGNDEENIFCLTNGALWRYVSGSRETYVCPSHAKKMSQTPPVWSYLMNAYFGWYANGETDGENYDHIEYGRMEKADKVLLFCEVPFDGVGAWQPTDTGSGIECDCVLQFDVKVETKTGSRGINPKDAEGQENIGFNHKSGKMRFANVVFADGHVEKLRLPKNGMGDTEMKELTAWLCTGTDISFDGRQYRKLDQ